MTIRTSVVAVTALLCAQQVMAQEGAGSAGPPGSPSEGTSGVSPAPGAHALAPAGGAHEPVGV